jgi:hypothetical protein
MACDRVNFTFTLLVVVVVVVVAAAVGAAAGGVITSSLTFNISGAIHAPHLHGAAEFLLDGFV